MINQIKQIFEDLNDGTITMAEAEQEVINLWEDNQFSTECNCNFFTVGEHSDSCPKRLFS